MGTYVFLEVFKAQACSCRDSKVFWPNDAACLCAAYRDTCRAAGHPITAIC